VPTAGTQRDGVLAGMHQKLFRQNPCTYIIKRSVNGYKVLILPPSIHLQWHRILARKECCFMVAEWSAWLFRAEKALKGFLAFHKHDIPKIYELVKLVALCEAIDPSFIELTDAAKFLTPKATEFRYTDEADSVDDVAEMLPSIEEVQQAIEKATLILNFVKQKIEIKTTEHAE
jgi:HEPN domain-containing protein